MTAFAVAGGGAVITYTAGVINANKEVKLYQPDVPQVENGTIEEGTMIYSCIFHIDRDMLRTAYENDMNYDRIYDFACTTDENVYAYIFNAGDNMQFRVCVKNQPTFTGNGGDTLLWSDSTRTMTGMYDFEFKQGYEIPEYGSGYQKYTVDHPAFRLDSVRPGFEGAITIENLPWRL